jgi:hypothetical protein
LFKTLNIPLEATQQAIQDNNLHELRVYLALKFQAVSGQIRHADVDWTLLSDVSGFQDKRTLKTHINTLHSLNWIGSDKDWLFVRSLDRIRKLTRSTSRTAVEIRPDDVPHILELLLGAKIEHSARAKRHVRKKPGAEPAPLEPYTSDNLQPERPYSEYAYSCTLIGDWFHFSPSSATRLKQRARKLGYLTYRHVSQTLSAHRSNFADIVESIGIEAERLFIHNGRLKVRLTDVFTVNRNGFHEYKFKTRVKI